MEENSSPTPETPVQPPPAPIPPAPPSIPPRSHKTLFIGLSIFAVFVLLAVSGVLYFENYSAPIAKQSNDQNPTTSFSGRLVLESRYSVPSFEENPDTNQTIWIPFLIVETSTTTQKIQLIGSITSLSALVGDDVVVTGNLQSPQGRDQYTDPVLLVDTVAQNPDGITWVKYSNATASTTFAVSSYYVKDNLVYEHFYGDVNELLTGANPQKFQAYIFVAEGGDDTYGKDDQHVWFSSELMPSADAATFTVFDTTQHCDDMVSYPLKNYYTEADKNHTYSQDQQTDCPTPIK